MITINSDPRVGEAILQSMRENPHDSAHRKIYADWLEENGKEDEALHHRIIAHLMDRGSEAARLYSEQELNNRPIKPFHTKPRSIRSTVNNPLYVFRRGRSDFRRLSTPYEATKLAHLATTVAQNLTNTSRHDALARAQYQSSSAEQMVTHHAYWGGRKTPNKNVPSYHALHAHDTAALWHLRGADELEGQNSEYHRVFAPYHRRAGLAHLMAEFVHDRALRILHGENHR